MFFSRLLVRRLGTAAEVLQGTLSLLQISQKVALLPATAKTEPFYASLVERLPPHLAADADGEYDFYRALLKDIQGNTEGGVSSRLANLVVSSFLHRDYSLAYTKLELLEPATRLALLQHNPGRATSSYEVWTKHRGQFADEAQAAGIVMDRLVAGEQHEQSLEFEPSTGQVARAVAVAKGCGLATPELVVAWAVDNLLPSALHQVLGYLEAAPESLASVLLRETRPEVFAAVFSLNDKWDDGVVAKAVEVLGREPGEITPKVLLEEFTLAMEQDGAVPTYTATPYPLPAAQYDLLVASLGATALAQIRAAVVRSLAVDRRDLPAALDLFTGPYSTHPLPSHPDLQSVVLRLCCLEAVRTGSPVYTQLAGAFADPTGMRVVDLCGMVAASAVVSTEHSLELFNNHIQETSREAVAGMSPAAQLVESAVVAFLSQRDREFALLVMDGAVREGVISDTEKVVVQRWMKKYGEVAEEADGDEQLKGMLERYIIGL